MLDQVFHNVADVVVVVDVGGGGCGGVFTLGTFVCCEHVHTHTRAVLIQRVSETTLLLARQLYLITLESLFLCALCRLKT